MTKPGPTHAVPAHFDARVASNKRVEHHQSAFDALATLLFANNSVARKVLA